MTKNNKNEQMKSNPSLNIASLINNSKLNYKKSIYAYTLSFSLFVFIGCTKNTETFQTEPLSNFYPQQVGKYYTYRLDSTVFTNFGRTETIRKYQVKHTIESQITDNLGRPSFRILRSIRDSAGLQPWVPSGTYFVTPLPFSIETVEENLRFIKLVQPIRKDYKWKGNRYISTNPYGSLYNFSNDDNMYDWDYVYADFQSSTSITGKIFKDVYTVEQANESINVPIVSTSSYASLTRSVEKFAKNIGLVYREHTLWEYQPNPGGPSPYKIGFGIKMWLIDNN